MNRQVSYVVYAFLFLVVAGTVLRFIQIRMTAQRIPDTHSSLIDYCKPEQNNELSKSALKGKTLFMNQCASCHAVNKNLVGPSLAGFTEREPWTNRQNVYDWIRNPAAFMKKNNYAFELKKKYESLMMAFPDLSDEEIDSICDYLYEISRTYYSPVISESITN